MSKTEETNTKFSCEFCKKSFARERTLFSHICESKRRWLDKDKVGNRLGFQSFVQFYKKHSSAKNTKTYDEFIKSPYYSAFVKFGTHCADVNVVNVSRFVDWLLADQISIDNWTSDKVYTKFLIEYLRKEDAFDAIHRSVETTINLSESQGIQPKDLLRYGNPNKICYQVTLGKISPWMLYQSDSGIQFLDTLNPDHAKLIIDYIDPEQWALKFKREPELARQIKEVLTLGGY
jgi:hypothetical protein